MKKCNTPLLISMFYFYIIIFYIGETQSLKFHTLNLLSTTQIVGKINELNNLFYEMELNKKNFLVKLNQNGFDCRDPNFEIIKSKILLLFRKFREC